MKKKTISTGRLKDGSIAEKVIQKQILRWLGTTGLLHWRQNSGKVPVRGRMIRLGPDGISDIVVIVPPNGRMLGLEVKSARGVLRKAQRLFRARLEASGGIYMVVRSVPEAMGAVAQAIGTQC